MSTYAANDLVRTFGLVFTPLLATNTEQDLGGNAVKIGKATTMRLKENDRQSSTIQSEIGRVGTASRIVFLAKRKPVVSACFISSLLLFIVSLTQDCFFIDRAENPRAWANGFGLLMTGWLGVLVGVMAWVANPTLLIAWLAMWSPNHKRYSIGASAIALLLALSFLKHESIVADEAGNRSMITGYGIGLWLWISSIAVALVGSCSWISVAWQELNTRRKRVRFVVAIIGLVVVYGAAQRLLF